MPSYRRSLAEEEIKADAELAGYGPIPHQHDSSASEDDSEQAIHGVRAAIHKNKPSHIMTGGPNDSQKKNVAEMQHEGQFQSPESFTTIINPVIKASWGPDVGTGNASHVLENLDSALQRLQVNLQDTARHTVPHQGLTNTPRIRPPPPTPPEQAHLSQSLSTPTLPNFHAISEPALVSSYQIQRSLNPILFDAHTREIQAALVSAKVERCGRAYLEEGDYTVELASREDAEKAERYVRRRGISDLPPVFLAEAEKAVKEGATKHTQTTADTQPTSEYHVSGSMRHQHTRTTTNDKKGEKITLKTWVEITQEVFVPVSTIQADTRPTAADVSESVRDNRPAVEVARMQQQVMEDKQGPSSDV